MTAQLYQFVRAEEEIESPVDPDIQNVSGLAVLPTELISGLFDRLSAEDKRIVLQERALPVACLPNYTLYGVSGAQARELAETSGRRVIAQIAAGDLENAIQHKLGPEILADATNGLRSRMPHYSSYWRLSAGQVFWFASFAASVFMAYQFLQSEFFFALASFVFGLFFLSIVALRVLCLFESSNPRHEPVRALSEEELPVYSVLVPVFRETQVLNQLVGALSKLNYPKSKLDIKLIIEETDTPMQRAVAAINLPSYFEVVVVPAGKPQTKPRALNYALQFARGSLLTIYDAEDVPEPQQLRKAAAAFAAAPSERACLQAELAFYNSNENWLTRQFTVEYGVLFKLLLPAFVKEHLPIPLSGTSNHFRISVLRDAGGWDPYNVTEDADLGFRLARMGYTTAVLDSVTYEEATLVLRNWVNQRARWLKGFMQTWLVHNRNPVKAGRAMGLYGWWAMQSMTFGLVISALFHPFLVGYAMYILISGHLMDGTESTFMSLLMGLNVVVLLAGYAISIFVGAKALRHKHIFGWGFVLATMPIYWMLMTLAAWLALWQLIRKPHYWNKTKHGQSRLQSP